MARAATGRPSGARERKPGEGRAGGGGGGGGGPPKRSAQSPWRWLRGAGDHVTGGGGGGGGEGEERGAGGLARGGGGGDSAKETRRIPGCHGVVGPGSRMRPLTGRAGGLERRPWP